MRAGPPPVACRAAETLLDRAWGRPSQEINLALEAELTAALDRLKAALPAEAYTRALEALAVKRSPSTPEERADVQ